MRVLVVGAGGVGSAVAPSAARRDCFERIVFTDIDLARAETAAARDERFGAARLDASDAGAIAELARAERVDAILNAADPRFNPPIFAGALAAGCTYLDMAMTLSEPGGKKLGDDQFAEEERWRAAGQLALVASASSRGSATSSPATRRITCSRRSTRSACATARISSSTATTSRRRSRSGRRSRSA
jgi:saccharopine dehydrogenase (NAD+, L-lysine-forming)